MIPLMSVLASFVFFGLLMVFIFFIISLWSNVRVRRQSIQLNELSDEERERLNNLYTTAERLERRIQVLETILDQSVPEWRKTR